MSNKKMGYVPGVIIFVALIIFFGAILWLSGKNILFSKYYRVNIEFSDVAGLRDQAPVYLRGYRVGRTDSVNFEGEKIKVAVDIKKEFKIPVDSTFEIKTLTLIGEKAITINPGDSLQVLQPGAVVPGVNKDIITLAENILTTAQAKIEEGGLDQIIQKVSESMDATLTLVRKMQAKVDKLDMAAYNQRFQEIGQATLQLQEFFTQAREDTEKISRVSSESMENFNQTLEKVDVALEQLTDLSTEIRRITLKINRGEGTAGELVQNREFFENLNRTMLELSDFLADIKKNPKKYVRFSIF